MTSVFSWQNSISLWPASFCTPRPNLTITPGVSWLPTFAFQSPIMKRTFFFLGVSSRRSCRSSWCQISGCKSFPCGSVLNNAPANAGDAGLILGLGIFPWSRNWQPTPVFLLGKFHGQRSLAGYSPWGCRESNTTEHTHTLGLLTSQEPRCLQLENDQPSNPQDFSKLKESGTSDTTDQGTFVETNTCDWWFVM